jgi:N utilization substance protein B
MGVRHRGRELAFQILFQTDQTGDKVNAVIARFTDMRHANADSAAFAEDLAVGAFKAIDAIDTLIRSAAQNWKLERLLSVDRALLRLGVYELSRRPEIPAEVTLDECIELAKIYGSDESAAFVNGVLDTLARQLRPDSGEDADLPSFKAKGPKAAAVPKAPRQPKPAIRSHAIPKKKVKKV